MGAGASLQEDVPTGWHALAAMAEAADKPDLVAKIVRENQIDAATALKLDDDDLRELVDRKLDFKKLQGARDELRERLVPARAGGTHLVSSDSEDDASDGDEIPPHVPRISNDEIDRAEALDARGGVFAATWRPCKGQPVAVALKAVDAVDLAEVFALRSFADPNVLVLYGVVVASDVATVAERPDAPLDVILCGNPLPRVDSLRVARDMASALTFLHSREVAHLRLAPSNVLCHRAPHLRCKVADFGASVSAAIERLERSPRARAYAAPELLEAVRAPSAAAARRDLYACDAWAYGCVLAEVLSGTAPWDGVDGEGILAQVVDAARAPDLPEKTSTKELLTLARECFARAATPRPAMGDVVARVEALLEADYARGASSELRLAKVEAAIEAEEASDRATYKEAWRCCTTASGDAAIDRLLKLSESLAATYAATPRHAALARDAPVAELLDLAAEVGESVHATLKRVVTAAGGTYEEGPLKTKARIQQKRRSADYGGDLARVVDVVRGQGIFHDNQADAFEAALQGLVADAASGEEAKGEEDRLVLVRVKDRLNTPVEKSGHRDVLINFEHELTAVRKFETIWPLSHWLISAQAHGLRRRAPTDVQRPSGRQGVGAPDLQHLACSRGRRRGGGGRERAQPPQLGRPLAGRARVESDRPLALRRIDRAAKGARARAAPGTSRVRHLRRDRRRGESAPRPRRRRGAPATARRRPRWLHRRKAPRGSRARGGRPRRVRATPRDVAAPL